MARESDAVFPILAGPEIGVASTKAFTCQLGRPRFARARRRSSARGTLDETEGKAAREAAWPKCRAS
ncbi:MAG: hypothetical protein KL839_03300 [Rhizobium sp.]|nr:hypothetical protein [Rhizobium sp.]